MRAAVLAALMAIAAPEVSAGWMPPQAREEDARVAPGRLHKLGRGLTNVITSPGELIRTPQAEARDAGWGRGLAVGIPYGLWRTVLRAVVGVFEVATFYAEVPEDYAPLIRPEYVFESTDVRRH
jgi:putative exosortase-associated protein (TIGR04073 family)